MSVTFEKLSKATVIALEGRLDSTNSATIEGEILGQTSADNLVLDISRLDYISSAGLRVVLVLAKRARQAEKRFILAGMQSHIRDVFDISGFLSILDTADSQSAALAQI